LHLVGAATMVVSRVTSRFDEDVAEMLKRWRIDDVNVAWVAAVFVAIGACTAPPPHGGGIPIHHEGVAARMRLACGLGIASAGGATCTNEEAAPAEIERSDATDQDNASRDGATEATDEPDAARGVNDAASTEND
jgi:hypothetical protein